MKDGDLDKATGRIKKAAGDLTGDDDMRREGTADETAGKAKNAVDRAEDKLHDTIDDAKEAMHRDR